VVTHKKKGQVDAEDEDVPAWVLAHAQKKEKAIRDSAIKSEKVLFLSWWFCFSERSLSKFEISSVATHMCVMTLSHL